MSIFLKRSYKELIIAGIITCVIFVFGHYWGVSIIDDGQIILSLYIAVHVFCFLLCWLILTALLHRFPLYQILIVLGILFVGAGAEAYFSVAYNPVTIPSLILFWMSLTYLVIPTFFKKYRYAFIAVNAAVIVYYLLFRTSPDYKSSYQFVVTLFLIFSISLMILVWAYDQWRWLTNLHADKVKAELTLLKNQINPHFFFNTLNNLYGLAVEKSDKAPEMILKLSDIMRYTIYKGSADFVSLESEVAYLEDYIELHKIRYQKQVEISMVKELAHPHKIAPILLIVPLENAFKHGVEKLTENAFINLEIKTTASQILFRISNNYESTKEQNGGLGLENFKKRLALIYPDKHELTINQTSTSYELRLAIEII